MMSHTTTEDGAVPTKCLKLSGVPATSLQVAEYYQEDVSNAAALFSQTQPQTLLY